MQAIEKKDNFAISIYLWLALSKLQIYHLNITMIRFNPLFSRFAAPNRASPVIVIVWVMTVRAFGLVK